MITDTSAIMAIMQKEPESLAFLGALTDAREAATPVEPSIVADSRVGTEIWPGVVALLRGAEVELVPLTAEHAALARQGWRRHSRGRHPAGLNLGDCFACAIAESLDQPLLFKGDDFARTDVKAAI